MIRSTEQFTIQLLTTKRLVSENLQHHIVSYKIRMKKCGQDIISNTFTAKIRRIQLEQGNTRTNSELVFLWLYLYSIDWRYNIRQMGRKGRNVVWYRNTFVRKYFVSCNGKVRQLDIKMTSKI